MKHKDAPRKVYTRCGIIHVCYEGALYAPDPDARTDVRLDRSVTLAPSRGAGLLIRQNQGGAHVSETWYKRDIGKPAKGKIEKPAKVKKPRERGTKPDATIIVPNHIKASYKGPASPWARYADSIITDGSGGELGKHKDCRGCPGGQPVGNILRISSPSNKKTWLKCNACGDSELFGDVIETATETDNTPAQRGEKAA